MIKFVLILYLCTSASGQPVCNQESIMPYEYADYSTCVIHGYRHSHNRLIANYDVDTVNLDKLAYRFECKEINIETT